MNMKAIFKMCEHFANLDTNGYLQKVKYLKLVSLFDV
jgi:hypothetical protein